MRHETIALGVFILTSIALFSGVLRRPGAGKIMGIVIAIAAAVYLIVALPPSLSPWARPHHVDGAQPQARALRREAPVSTSAPVVTVSPDGLFVTALQTTFNVTRSGLNTLYRAATADQTRVVSDETVLQTIVGVVLTLLFGIFGFIGTAVRRAVQRPAG
jgi:hypothetical protein